jgi:hypothetical protein
VMLSYTRGVMVLQPVFSLHKTFFYCELIFC